MRIGVVADTHYPEFLDEFPEAVFERLRGCELILHAGDVGGPEVLEKLRRLAPVEAVRGDHDEALPDLPRERILEIEGRRVALVHGNRSRLLEEPATFIGTVSLGLLWPNPGAVYQTDRAAALRRLGRRPNWFEWSWLQVIRHRRRVAVPTVGVLEIGPSGIRAEVLPLD